tara:strand:- start:1994 stop:2098 length:105 start_codon:yes stop_codon:yes gene_type:complete
MFERGFTADAFVILRSTEELVSSEQLCRLQYETA